MSRARSGSGSVAVSSRLTVSGTTAAVIWPRSSSGSLPSSSSAATSSASLGDFGTRSAYDVTRWVAKSPPV